MLNDGRHDILDGLPVGRDVCSQRPAEAAIRHEHPEQMAVTQVQTEVDPVRGVVDGPIDRDVHPSAGWLTADVDDQMFDDCSTDTFDARHWEALRM